ncbi:phosphotransferase system HPr (HPr) family protein [Halobacteroides halobius DSM 5150]|uniref:Phosphocarrier protein HPr n=1 Tax=Halobacteroides halobius (strain ATCC 35273 / DSM 5150 / MD-1) TaxID=748449 RepID=L0KDG7_HALHC|nr:HPr family phosphocarrier protein [Halobacteroides halobius]AGB42414.1 phosphotransferase system HPr (HPr) family protein [Halobacteroides halobius DSM 5150]
MVEQKVTVNNDTGIHARPASMIVSKAEKFDADVKISKDGQEVNAKSIMGIMSLGVNQSTEVTIKADGADAKDAVAKIVELIEDGFGE